MWVGYRRFIAVPGAGYLLEGGTLQTFDVQQLPGLPAWVAEQFGVMQPAMSQKAKEDAFLYLWDVACAEPA